MKKLILTLIFVIWTFPAFAESVALYRTDADMFKTSAEIVEYGLGIKAQPIQSTKRFFLGQISKANNILYIAAHGSMKGIKITDQVTVSWETIADNINASIVIFDTCFSGQGLNTINFNGTSFLGISSTSLDYSYNPKLFKDSEARCSILAAALATYFTGVDIWEDINLLEFNSARLRSAEFRGMTETELMLREISKNHLMLYLQGINNEGITRFVNSFYNLEPPVKAIWPMQYKKQ